MAYKIPVVDRVPTFPGRVTLTPVSGQADTYDMVRADSPIEEGTPINKALFDQKAYTLTDNVTIYVSPIGSDVTGTGKAEAPYLTIQKAINDLPKCLGGKEAIIDVADGTYEERVIIDSFYSGRLTVGVDGKNVTVRGVEVRSSTNVVIKLSYIKYGGLAGNLLHADYGSNVTIMKDLIIHGESATVSGLTAARGSVITTGSTVEVRGCKAAAVYASSGSRIALGAINGTNGNTSYAIRADMGGVVSFSSQGLTATLGNITSSGGRILNGSGTTMASASVE